MLSVHKIMHFIHQKHHNMPFQTYYMTKNRLKTHYTNLTNKFGIVTIQRICIAKGSM